MWLFYEKALRIYRKNEKIIENPLKKMIYNPGLCRVYKSMNRFLEVPET